MHLCPRCDGKLVLVSDGEVGSAIMPSFYVRGDFIRYEMHPEPFLACTECEFCQRFEETAMAGTTTRDLEEMGGQPPATCGTPLIVTEEASDPEMDEMLSDLLDGRSLLKRANVLLDYLSDSVLVRQITKKEREAMDRLSILIDAHIDGTTVYEE